jgi:DNA modification methylase
MQPTWTSKCGSARLYLGDCMDVLPEITTDSVDAVVTDPPYGISYEASKSRQQGITRFAMLNRNRTKVFRDRKETNSG